ncbi:MAG: hypothetical protein ABSG05_03320 [Candidatus Pacearchaeota archaeon]|jgi:hypothetical protein
MTEDAAQIKNRIVSIMMRRGPSIPVNISKEMGLTILFASAFLSELASEKTVKISHMRVGSSPVYYLPGQETSLEKFSQFLKSREKDAFLLLREKKFLKDREQSPAIRVALREIRDFAIPFNAGEEVVWRYYLVPESEFKFVKLELPKVEEKPILVQQIKEPVVELEPEPGKEKPLVHVIAQEKHEKTIRKEKLEKIKSKAPSMQSVKKKKPIKKDDKFFSSIKEFLSRNSIELLDIENFGKREIILKVKDKGNDKLLIAYNKSKITENDIINAAKKSSEAGVPYIILGQGGTLKKLDNLIEAIKNLSSIEKLK